MIDSNYEMVYSSSLPISPYSVLAGSLCQRYSDNTDDCGYPMCSGPSVGAAVHETTVKKDGTYVDGCHFIAVCQKHKDWEYATLKDVQPWGSLY